MATPILQNPYWPLYHPPAEPRPEPQQLLSQASATSEFNHWQIFTLLTAATLFPLAMIWTRGRVSLTKACRQASIKSVWADRPATNRIYREVRLRLLSQQRRLRDIQRRIEKRLTRATLPDRNAAMERTDNAARIEDQLFRLGDGLGELRRLGLPAKLDFMREGCVPILRVPMPDGMYQFVRRGLSKLDDDRFIYCLKEGSQFCFMRESLGKKKAREIAIYYSGKVFNWNGLDGFVDDFGNRLVMKASNGHFSIHPSVVPSMPKPPVPFATCEAFFDGAMRPLCPFPGQPGLFRLKVSSGESILVRYDLKKQSFDYARGFFFSPSGRSLYHNGLQYRITFSQREGRSTLVQAVSHSDRSRSLVFWRRDNGSIEWVSHPVRLRNVAARDGEALISCRGHTYVTYQQEIRDSDVIYASHIKGWSGLDENWIVVQRNRTLLKGKIQSFRSLTPRELERELKIEMGELRGLLDGPEVSEAQLPRPKSVNISGRGVESLTPLSPRLRDSGPLTLDRFSCTTSEGARFDIYVPRSTERVWTNEVLEESLRRMPNLDLANLERLVIVPRSRGLTLKDGTLIPGYTDFQRRAIQERVTVVLCDGSDATPEKLLIHELRGHGRFRNNRRIEQMAVLAMKRDGISLSPTAMVDVDELHSEAGELLVLLPWFSDQMRSTARFFRRMANIRPGRIRPHSFELGLEQAVG